MRVDRLDEITRLPGDVAIKARAEQRVNDHLRADEEVGAGFLGRTFPVLRGMERIAFQAVAVAEKQEPDRIAALGQPACGDKAVAAIVARPGHHHDAGSERMSLGNEIRHRAAGIGHECRAGHAGGNRQAIGFRHFAVRQKLDHC